MLFIKKKFTERPIFSLRQGRARAQLRGNIGCTMSCREDVSRTEREDNHGGQQSRA